MNTTANVAPLLLSTADTICFLTGHIGAIAEYAALLRAGADKPGRRSELRRLIDKEKTKALPLIGQLAVLCAQLEQSGRTEAVAKAARELSSWCCVVIAELDTASSQRLTEQQRWIEIRFEEFCEARNTARFAHAACR